MASLPVTMDVRFELECTETYSDDTEVKINVKLVSYEIIRSTSGTVAREVEDMLPREWRKNND